MKSLLRVRRDELRLHYQNYLKSMEKLFVEGSNLNINTDILEHYAVYRMPYMHKSLDETFFKPAYHKSYYSRRYA